MVRALILAETTARMKGSTKPVWVKSRIFVGVGVPKAMCDKLVPELYFDKQTPPPMYWSERTGNIFNPNQADVELDRDFRNLLSHVRVDRRVRQIVTSIMQLVSSTTIDEIRTTFDQYPRKERIRIYGAILRAMDRQSIIDRSYGYREFTYHGRNCLYRLTTRATSLLRRYP